MAQKTLLAVFAHPDDETFLAGPVLAHYSARGVAVHLCCATPELPPDAGSTAARRRASLACAAAVLGIRQVHHLNYAEPDLSHATVESLAARVGAVIQLIQPQVILTDAAYGSYGHPHHILLHRAAVAAAHAAVPTPRVYALAFPLPLVRLNERLLRWFGVPTAALEGRPDLNLRAILAGQHPTTVRMDVRAWVAARRRAAACYAQEIAAAPLPLRVLEAAPLWVQQQVFGQARFTRILPADGPGENDLFTHVPS